MVVADSQFVHGRTVGALERWCWRLALLAGALCVPLVLLQLTAAGLLRTLVLRCVVAAIVGASSLLSFGILLPSTVRGVRPPAVVSRAIAVNMGTGLIVLGGTLAYALSLW